MNEQTIKATVQTIHYILSKTGPIDKTKLLSLLYLADKYHLIAYGRTITDDKYVATKGGIIGLTASTILDSISQE